MACRRHFAVVMVVCVLGSAFAVPAERYRLRRGYADNELGDSKENGVGNTDSNSKSTSTSTSSSVSLVDVSKESDDDSFEDDDDFEPMQTAPSGGSNIFSLLRLATALFPSSSGATPLLRRMIREMLAGYNQVVFLRRQDVGDNEIVKDYVKGLKPPPPPFQRQETEEESSSSESDESGDNNGGEESLEEQKGSGDDKASNADNSSGSNDSEFDEPPEGDGQGGGILGLLAGLSGGEDGQSDLGDLLATVSGIVAQLSGDGIDLNALIASGLGLFVGLLSEGDENPGAVIASYLLTSLESITGGGAKNNGAFFGNLVSKLVKGTSAAGDPEDEEDDDENGEGNRTKMADSAGFFASLLMSLLGDMSKSSSGGSSHPWRRYHLQRLAKLDYANQ